MSVRDVIALDRLDEDLEPAALEEAAQAASAHRFINALPAGYQTMLSSGREDGTALSGGQWQRLALARAALRKASTLQLFDEPESGLDPATAESLRHSTFRTIAR